MARKKIMAAVLFSATALNTASACAVKTPEGAGEQSKSRTQPTPTPQQAPPLPATNLEDKLGTTPLGEIKELASGGYSPVKESFIIVARDAATYANLKALHEGLPDLGADFFKSNAVVAAYLGQRRSGGYGVHIERSHTAAGTLRISEQSPPKDAMVTMALTAAFRIVSVAVRDESPLALELDATWREAVRPYKISDGVFTRIGGFAGRPERSMLKGELRVMRHGNLATIFFNLHGTGGADGPHALQDVATATVATDGALSIARLDAGSFVPPPRHPLRVRGNFSANEDRLSLAFEVMEAKVADGYGGQGKLEANATAPAPRKRAVDGDDPM